MTIKAQVIADSVSEAGIRLTTLQLRYPKFIHFEFMTHRTFSRNASSSRAIPVERLIRDVLDDPVYPSSWGKNQPGMQAREEHGEHFRMLCIGETDWLARVMGPRQAWDEARSRAVDAAQCFARAGYHKQIVNRLLEPFCHINVVVTATEWDNFFSIRCHLDAQPEMRELAEKMRDAMKENKPIPIRHGDWHLPYADRIGQLDDLNEEKPGTNNLDMRLKCSVARCARVSYLTQDGKKPSVESDVDLYNRLVGAVPLHASPAEHQATPDKRTTMTVSGWLQPMLHGNFRGWIQHRKQLEEKV